MQVNTVWTTKGRVGGAVLVAFILATVSAVSEDWHLFRGAGRLAVLNETGIIGEFPEAGLKVTWRVAIRSGFSGPAVADGRVFVTDWEEDPDSRTIDGTERIVVIDEQTGEELWTYAWGTTNRTLLQSYAGGPMATPTVDGDRVYVLGATGLL